MVNCLSLQEVYDLRKFEENFIWTDFQLGKRDMQTSAERFLSTNGKVLSTFNLNDDLYISYTSYISIPRNVSYEWLSLIQIWLDH